MEPEEPEDIADLRREIDSLRREVAALKGEPAVPPEPTPSTRRGAFRMVGMAGAAAVAGVVASPRPAAAADPNDVVKSTGNATTAATGLSGGFGGEVLRVENTGSTSTSRAIYARSGATDVGAIRGDNPNDSGIGGVGVSGYAPGGRDFLAFGSGRIGLNSHTFNTSTHSYTTGEIHQVNGTLYLMVNASTRRVVAGPTTAGALHLIDPVRVYDSRSPQPSPGKLVGGQKRVLSVASARDADTGAVTTANVVPVGATAVHYTLYAVSGTGKGMLTVVQGAAATTEANSVSWVAGQNRTGSSVSRLDGNRQIAVFARGATTVSTHFMIDVQGYYL